MKQHGLSPENDRDLVDLYNKLDNKLPKKYVHAAMVARVIASTIWDALKEEIHHSLQKEQDMA